MVSWLNFVIIGALIALFVFLFLRARRARNGVLKWVGMILTGLLTVLLAVVFVGGLVGAMRLNAKHGNPVADVTVAMTPEQVARGERIAQVCTGCHTADGQLPLEGQNFLGGEGGAPPVGTLYAPNLTPAHFASWSDGEIIRAIREGVHKSGRSLIVMPSRIYRNMSDEDVQALVAYLRSQPAVEPNTPANRLNLIGVAFTFMAPLASVQPAITQPVIAPPPGPTAEYGQYLISFAGCVDCHGEKLEGGVAGGGPPPGPNLTKIVPTWTEEQFMTLFRTGVDPSGETVSEDMPWQEFDKFASDDDLRAMFAYLHGLTPSGE